MRCVKVYLLLAEFRLYSRNVFQVPKGPKEARVFRHERLHDLTELIVTKDMSERKARMIELGDAFIAFPGGTGTLEEISEVMSKVSLRHLNAPCIIYNLNNYYDGLITLLNHMKEMDLSSDEKLKGIYFADSLEEIESILSI